MRWSVIKHSFSFLPQFAGISTVASVCLYILETLTCSLDIHTSTHKKWRKSEVFPPHLSCSCQNVWIQRDLSTKDITHRCLSKLTLSTSVKWKEVTSAWPLKLTSLNHVTSRESEKLSLTSLFCLCPESGSKNSIPQNMPLFRLSAMITHILSAVPRDTVTYKAL